MTSPDMDDLFEKHQAGRLSPEEKRLLADRLEAKIARARDRVQAVVDEIVAGSRDVGEQLTPEARVAFLARVEEMRARLVGQLTRLSQVETRARSSIEGLGQEAVDRSSVRTADAERRAQGAEADLELTVVDGAQAAEAVRASLLEAESSAYGELDGTMADGERLLADLSGEANQAASGAQQEISSSRE